MTKLRSQDMEPLPLEAGRHSAEPLMPMEEDKQRKIVFLATQANAHCATV